MSKTVQWKRGNANVSSTYTGAQGEITVDTSEWGLRVHDGLTPGGYKISNDTDGNVNVGNLNINDQTIQGKISGQDVQIVATGAANVVLFGQATVVSNDIYVQGNGVIDGISIQNNTISTVNPSANLILTAGNVSTSGNFYANILRLKNENFYIAEVFSGALARNVVSIFSGLSYPQDITVRANNTVIGLHTSAIGTVGLRATASSSSTVAVTIGGNTLVQGNITANGYSAPEYTGYTFSSNTGTISGITHRELDANINILSVLHDNFEVARFFSNNQTQLTGNLIITGGPGVSNQQTFSESRIQVYSNVNTYSQIVHQNLNAQSLSSSDYVATANNGSDTTYYIDLGIAGNLHNDPAFFGDTTTFNDAYLYTTGYSQAGPSLGNVGNLIIGSTNGLVKTFIGNTAQANVVTVVDSTGLLPGANVTYNLGSATRQWKDLWLSNSTMYLGGFPITVSNTGVLSVNGSPVTSNASSYGNANVTSYLPTYTGNIAGNISKNGNVWTFGTNGTTTFPTNISIDYSGGNVQFPRIIADSGKSFSVQGQGNIGSAALSWTVDPDSAGQYAAVAVTKVGGDNLAKVILQAQSDSGDAATVKLWTFNETGNLTLPNGAVIKDNAGDSVAFGQSAGATSQGNSAVAIGHNAGVTSQGTFTVAIGRNAGQTSQGGSAVAVGVSAGDVSQGVQAVAVGNGAGGGNQGNSAVAIGVGAGQSTQGVEAVAIGNSAGSLTQGISAIAIGKGAGRNFQGNNSIIINATGADLDQTTANTFTVAPVRNDVANVAEILFYNTTSKEVTYGNTISVAGNVTGNYILGNGSQLTSINAVTVDITDTNGLTTVYYPTFVENRTTAQIARADVDLTYRTDDNLLTVGNVSVTGNVSGNYFIGNGSQLTGIAASYGNANVVNFLANGYGSNTIVTTGNITGGNITGNTGGFAIGYRDIPQVVFTSNATLALTDAGKHYFSSNSANVITVPNNTTVSFNIGTAISIVQQGTANLTVTPGSGVTMYLAGNSTSSSRTVGNYGMATLMKVGTDTWFINGTGVN